MKKAHALIGAGLVICAILLVINIYLGGIGIVILGTLVMIWFIMDDSQDLPLITVELKEDTKGIIVANRGNATARAIHVALIPLNLEYDIISLAPDKQAEFTVDTMISSAKAAVTFENSTGIKKTITFPLSAFSGKEDDVLKPVFPLFSWK
ncbi:MAG: hypothetical protein WC391_09500 [Methanoregula sp.]|jgi:hypothetical protein